MNPHSFNRQRGVVLMVSLIMLVLITMMVTTNYNFSATNLQSVGNMQFRNEALAAANVALVRVISSPFTDSPAAETIDVDIDDSGTTDYVVAIAQPQCIRATRASSTPPGTTSGITVASGDFWNTVWDIDATVSSADNAGGAAVHLHTGVRILLDETQKNAVCP